MVTTAASPGPPTGPWTKCRPLYTHILVGGLVGADQVGVEPRQTDDGPDREEAHHQLQNGAEQSQGETSHGTRLCDELMKQLSNRFTSAA